MCACGWVVWWRAVDRMCIPPHICGNAAVRSLCHTRPRLQGSVTWPSPTPLLPPANKWPPSYANPQLLAIV